MSGPSNTSRFLRRQEVEQLVGLSASEVYRRISAGTFPKQIKISPRFVRWNERDIVEWMEKQRAGGSS